MLPAWESLYSADILYFHIIWPDILYSGITPPGLPSNLPSVTLLGIKYGDGWKEKKRTQRMDAFHKNSLLLSRLKNFVKIPGVQVFALIQKMLLSEHL